MTKETENDNAPQGLGRPGPNLLFLAVLVAVCLGVLAGLTAGDGAPSSALRSNVVFRIEVGAVATLAGYWTAAALWLAWHRTLLRRVGVGSAGVESPDQKAAVKTRDEKVEKFMVRTTESLDDLVHRVERLEALPDSVEERRGNQSA